MLMRERDPLQRLFLREKPVLALLAIGEMESESAYAAMIAKCIDSTFPHTSSILTGLESQGLVKSRPEGRIRYLELTDRGRRIARALQELSDLLRKPDAMMQRLERLRKIISLTEDPGPGAAFRLGPMRRDLAKLKGLGDPMMRKAAEELDNEIAAIVRG
jgi:DNA-binding MarR family transcriptional regulator